MYGLGIRIGFYLQWYSHILSDWLAPSEVGNLRTSNSLFLAAIFLALVIKTVRNAAELRATEAYIVLLFAFGNLFMLPTVVILRVLTWNRPEWDPWRRLKIPSSNIHKFLINVLICAVSAFGLWFWIAGVYNPMPNCGEYGFLFYRIELRSGWFRILHIILNGACLGTGLVSLYVWLGWVFRGLGADDEGS
jgi:hypothetical protein